MCKSRFSLLAVRYEKSLQLTKRAGTQARDQEDKREDGPLDLLLFTVKVAEGGKERCSPRWGLIREII